MTLFDLAPNPALLGIRARTYEVGRGWGHNLVHSTWSHGRTRNFIYLLGSMKTK